MRILSFLLSGCEYGKIIGGAERRFFQVSEHLRNLGVEILALEYESLHSEKWGQPSYFPIKIKRRFPNHAILSASRIVVLGLIACIKYRCQIIYVTCRLAWAEGSLTGLIIPYIVSCLCKKPLVIIFHHVTPSDYMERHPIRLQAYRKATCMAVSEATANDIKKCFRIKNVVVVGNGVDLDLFKTVDYMEEKYDAVFLGRITKEKGIFVLLRTWKDVISEIPSAQLLLIGGIDRNIKEELRKTIQELQLKQNVTVTGFVSDRRMLQLLSASKIFVLPSKMEGFGLSVAEAMAAGLPCVLSNLPALKENFDSAAVFVEPEDAEGFAQAILTLLSDPEKCRELREKGQKLVRQFSWDSVAKKELKIFRSVLEK